MKLYYIIYLLGYIDGVRFKRDKSNVAPLQSKGEDLSIEFTDINSKNQILDLNKQLLQLRNDFTIQSRILHQNVEEVKKMKSYRMETLY